MLRPTDILTLDVILTASCNLSCGYCYQNAKQQRHMSWDVLQASIDWLLSSTQREVRLIFVGGEPLLAFDLIERAVAYIDRQRLTSPAVSYALITNGILIDDHHLQFFCDHRIDVQLSFDGVKEAQRLRGLRTFDRLDLLLQKLSREYPEFLGDQLTVSLTLLPATIPHLADSIDYFLAAGVGQIAIAPANGAEETLPTALLESLTTQFERIFTVSVARFERTGEVPLLLFRKNKVDSVHSAAGMSMCGVGRGENPAVDVDGRVFGCVTFAESYQIFPTDLLRTRLVPMRMGDLRAPDFAQRLAAYPKAADRAEIFSNRSLKHSSFAECCRCEYLSTCAICPTSIGHIPGNADPHRVPDFLCAYNLVSQRFRREFPLQPEDHRWLTSVPPLSQLSREFLAAMLSPAAPAEADRTPHDR